MKIYLDNAATTPLDKAVFEAMTPYLLNVFGNPSSHHQIGREAKQAIRDFRATIAGLLNARADEITFTSGGTEADNMAILSAINANGVNHVITTRMEHHAVLHTLSALQKEGRINVSFIDNDEQGNLDLHHLKTLLQGNANTLVSVMHANNEIGNLNDIEAIAQLCQTYNALFHTDTVQTVGHYRFDLSQTPIHFLTASAHKFHGPKGVGFLYCRSGVKLSPLIHGGGQENKLRAGTENIAGIAGLTAALQLAYQHIDEHQQHIQALKNHLINRLTDLLPGVQFNGCSAIQDKSLYTVLSVSLPENGTNLLSHLDEFGIAVSGGSACSTGYASHVLQALKPQADRSTVRFSFSKLNTIDEVEQAATVLSQAYASIAA